MPEELSSHGLKTPTRILDRNGRLLYEVRDENYGAQHPLAFAEIPKNIIDALVATEDRSFYGHLGISPTGMARAAWQNFWAGKVVSGGSTITQQLVRNRLHPSSRGYWYKLEEAMYAIKLETRMSKNEILTDYLNRVYFGRQAYGVAAAARSYFGKNVSELSLAESTFLVGLVQSPSQFEPIKNFALAKARQKTVLNSLRDTGKLTDAQVKEAIDEPLNLTREKIDIRAPHFVMWMINNVIPAQAGIYAQQPGADSRFRGNDKGGGGDDITTTLDLNLQTEVERIVQVQLEKLKDKNVTSAAVVVLNAHTGELLSMVGSADYFDADHDGQVNVAVSARQPGSALKPFTYALALAKGATPATTVGDVETMFFTQSGNPYIPRNYDYGYHGLVRYRDALANSYNIAAVKVLQTVGVDTLLHFMRAAGITTLNELPDHYGLALTLGDGEVKLLELAAAYGVFARGGKTLGVKTLLDGPGTSWQQVLDPRVAYLITDILSDKVARIPEFGTDSPLNFDFPVAAKTGTTRNSRDNWTLGYTPDRIVGVWVGNADNTPMKGTSGITGAGPIFHDVMLAANAAAGGGSKAFPRPPGIVQKTVCRLSGKLPTPLCPDLLDEIFIKGTEPTVPDDLYQSISLDKRNNLRAGEGCPVDDMIQKTFTVFPSELTAWARENGWVSPPAAYSPLCPSGAQETGNRTQDTVNSWLTISSPHNGDSFKLDPLVPAASQKMIFQASASPDADHVQWFVNNDSVGDGFPPDFRLEWTPTLGHFQITAKAGSSSDKVGIEVIK